MNKVNELEIQSNFLDVFKQLEKFLRLESKFDFDESSYKRNIESSTNRIVRNLENKDILLIAGKIRNLIVHNNKVVFPSQTFLSNFEQLVQKIIHPKLVTEVMIPTNQCVIAKPHQTFFEVSNLMKINRITTVPILENDKVVGVFSETTLFQTLVDSEGNIIYSLKESRFREFMDKFGLESNTYFSFKFVNRNSNVYDCLDYFEKGYNEYKRLELIFVTENGNPNESLLGLVSIFDLLDYLWFILIWFYVKNKLYTYYEVNYEKLWST